MQHLKTYGLFEMDLTSEVPGMYCFPGRTFKGASAKVKFTIEDEDGLMNFCNKIVDVIKKEEIKNYLSDCLDEWSQEYYDFKDGEYHTWKPNETTINEVFDTISIRRPDEGDQGRYGSIIPIESPLGYRFTRNLKDPDIIEVIPEYGLGFVLEEIINADADYVTAFRKNISVSYNNFAVENRQTFGPNITKFYREAKEENTLEDQLYTYLNLVTEYLFASPDSIQKKIDQDPGGMATILSSYWKTLKKRFPELHFPEGYADDADTLGDLSDLGF